MPETYHLPNGKVIHSENPLSPDELDSLYGDDKSKGIFSGGLADTSIPISTRLSNLFFGQKTTKDPITGEDKPILGPEFTKVPGTDTAGKYIQNKLQNTGNWYAGAAGSILNDLIGAAGSSFDARALALGRGAAEGLSTRIPEEAAPISQEAAPIASEVAKPQPKLLGPAKSIQLPESKIPSTIMQPVNIDPFLAPITAEHQAQYLTEQEGKNIKPIRIETLQDKYDSKIWNQREAESELQDELESKTPNFQQVKDLKKEISESKNTPLAKPEVYLDPREGGREGIYESMQPNSSFANPLNIKNKNLANLNISKTNNGYYQSGKPAELLHPNRLEPASEILPGESTLNEAEASSHPPELSNITPPPGSARPFKPFQDVPAISYGGSADQVLASRDITKPIVTALRENGWDKAKAAEGKNIRILGDITDGMNTEQRTAFGRTIEGVATDEDEAVLSKVDNLEGRLKNYRSLMDSIFADSKVARSGDIGYIKDYFTHIKNLPEDQQSAFKDIFNFNQGKSAWKALFEKPLISPEGTGEASGIYDQGMGNVGDSPFTKERSGDMNDINYDVNKTGRTYIESMARDTYIRPQVEAAKKMIADLPDSKLKEIAEGYVKNITNFTSAPELNKAMQKFARFVIDTTSRSMLGFNPHLQGLHAMRLGPVYAELGAKDFANGVGAILKNPAAAYRETASLGMLPSELYPFKFQTGTEKINSILNFKSYVDFIDRSIAYNGYKSKYTNMGLSPEEAMTKAITDTKRVTFMTDPSRANLLLNPEYKNVTGRLVAQYKQVPAKVLEWIVQTGMQAKQNPAAFARASVLLGGAGALKLAGGPSLFHAPTSLMDWSAAGISEMGKIFTYAGKGQFDKAAEEAALWLTPAGLSMRRLLQ